MGKEPKYFETTDELREAIAKKYQDQPDAVVWISRGAAIALSKLEKNPIASVKAATWNNWYWVSTITVEGNRMSFKVADDGNEIFFYDLKQK